MQDMRKVDSKRIPRAFPRMAWQEIDPAVLRASQNVPTMLTQEEQRLYHWLTAHWARGIGEIVELGCFVGGSTARLAEGHRVAGLGCKIHAYDRFQINEDGKEKYLYPAGITRFEGSNMLPAVGRLLRPWAGRVALHAGQIEEQNWTGGAIEILVMDASKTAATTDRFAEMFFPSLIPGHSLVVQQDYLHWKQPWIAMQMELLAAHFTPVAFAPRHTIVFRYERALAENTLVQNRVSGLAPQYARDSLHGARARLRHLGVTRQLSALLAAARVNPGVEKAWEMTRPVKS